MLEARVNEPATFIFLEFCEKDPVDRLNAPSISRLLELFIEIEPVIVRLLMAWLALIVFVVPDIVMVEPVLVQADVITTLPEALIPGVPEQVNVPPVCEKSLVLRVPDMV